MKFCGIDYSYGCPALCFWDDTTELKFENLRFYAYYTVAKYCRQIRNNILILKQPDYANNEERFANIAKWAEAVILTEKPDFIALEGYAMGNSKNSNNICQTAENTALLKQALRRNGYDFEIITPSYVKKNFTGVGNALKPVMIHTFETVFNVNMRAIMDNLDAKDPKPIDDLIDGFANMVGGEAFKQHHPEFKSMKSLFIEKVAKYMAAGQPQEDIFELLKEEYGAKGSVVTMGNVQSAINCVNNGWYLGTPAEKETQDDPAVN